MSVENMSCCIFHIKSLVNGLMAWMKDLVEKHSTHIFNVSFNGQKQRILWCTTGTGGIPGECSKMGVIWKWGSRFLKIMGFGNSLIFENGEFPTNYSILENGEYATKPQSNTSASDSILESLLLVEHLINYWCVYIINTCTVTRTKYPVPICDWTD